MNSQIEMNQDYENQLKKEVNDLQETPSSEIVQWVKMYDEMLKPCQVARVMNFNTLE